MSDRIAMTPQQRKLSQGNISLYREMMVGERSSLVSFIGFELYQLFLLPLPGALGLGFRRLVLPFFLKNSAGKISLGRQVSIKRPGQISFGRGVLIDDGASLEVKSEEGAIEIGSHVAVGKGTIISAKSGTIILGNGVNISSGCRVATQSHLEIGESSLIAAFAYIGPGNHQPGDERTPLIERPMEMKGGVRIGKHVWIGTRATILDGVTIGDNAIIGAHSLVKDDVPAGAVVAGTPARIITGS